MSLDYTKPSIINIVGYIGDGPTAPDMLLYYTIIHPMKKYQWSSAPSSNLSIIIRAGILGFTFFSSPSLIEGPLCVSFAGPLISIGRGSSFSCVWIGCSHHPLRIITVERPIKWTL